MHILRTYVVLGASRGIGLGFVRKLSESADNKVFALVRDLEGSTELRALEESCENKNINIIHADLDDYKSLEGSIETCNSIVPRDTNHFLSLKAAAKAVSSITGGTLDVFICSGAKVMHERGSKTLETYPQGETIANDMLELFKTNAIGVTQAITYFLPLVRAGETKKIFVLTSGLGSAKYVVENKHPYAVPYSVSKAAVNLIVAKFAVTYKDVVFVAVNPGPVRSVNAPEEVFQRITAQLRLANPTYAGPKTVEESVKTHLVLFAKVTSAESGKHLHADGRDGDEFEI